MKQLDATPGFRDVRAPAPATKPLGALRESFTIEFNIDPEQLPKPSIDAAAPPALATTPPNLPLAPSPVNPLAIPVPPLKKP
jgi:general secretion pathway protein L